MSGSALLSGAASVSWLTGALGSWPLVATLLGNGYLFVILTTILTFILVGVCLLFKYLPHMFNDLILGSNNELSPLGIKLWMALIVLLPLFFDTGVLWFVLWWFIVLWGYLNVMEKRLAFVFISLIFFSSWISLVGAGFLTYSQTNINREMFAIDHGVGTSRDSIALASWAKNASADAEPMNVQAVSEIEKGNHLAAINLLSRALDLEPGNDRYYNHLGIALAALKRNHEATNAFDNAIALDRNNVVYHYNLSRLHQATYNLYEAEQSINKASGIDSARVRSFLDREEQDQDNGFIQEHVPLVRYLERQMKPSEHLVLVADALWNSALGLFPRNKAMYMSLAVIVILFLLGHIPEEKFTKRCNRCGNLYYSGKTSESGYPMCLQCHWLETKSKKQMTSVLAGKAEEIRQFRIHAASRTQKLDLMLPGMGSLWVNKTFRGLVRLAVFSASVILVITGGGIISSFIPLGFGISWHLRVVGVLFLGLLYLRCYKSPSLRYGV